MSTAERQWQNMIPQISKLLQCCSISIRKIISIAELFAEHNADIQLSITQCCVQLHRMVTIIENQLEQLELSERMPVLSKLFYSCLKTTLNLLSRLLQLVDIDLLKPLLSTNQPTVHFKRLADVTNFTELTKIYTQFALEFMQLIQLVSNKTKNPDYEKHYERIKTRLIMQQQLSQRCIILLLTSCKTCVHYPQCDYAANNRTMLFKQIRKSLDHMQELLIRQFNSNIIGVYTIPTQTTITLDDDFLIQQIEPFNQFKSSSNPLLQLNPITNSSIYRSLPNEQIYLPSYFFNNINENYFKQHQFHFPFYNLVNFLDYNNNFNNNQFNKLYNQSRAGTLITNENCKLININNFHWLDNFLLSNNLPINGARQSTAASNYFLPKNSQEYLNNNLDFYFNKFRLDNNYLNNIDSNKYHSTKYQQPLLFKEDDKLYKLNNLKSSYQLPKLNRENNRIDNLSRTTNYTSTNSSDIHRDNHLQFNDNLQKQQINSNLIDSYSNLLTNDGLGSSKSAASHCSSSLPVYNSDLIPNSPNNSFNLLPFSNGHHLNHPHHQQQQQLQSQLIQQQYFKQNVQYHYLLCQLQTLQQQQFQYYDNIFTNVFYNNDTESNTSKTDQCLTIHNLLCSFEELISLSRLTCHSQIFREKITQCLELGAEFFEEFTDSPYTSNIYREKIVLLNERILFELNQLLQIGAQMEKITLPPDNLETVINQILGTCSELKQQLQQSSLEQAHLLFKHSNPYDLLNRLRNSILCNDHSKYTFEIDLFIEHYEYLRDTVKQLHHIAPTQNQQIRTKHVHFCLSIFSSMVLNAAQTLINNFDPKLDSQMALTNYQVFFDFWIELYISIYELFNLIMEQTGLRPSTDKYLSATSSSNISNSQITTPKSKIKTKPMTSTATNLSATSHQQHSLPIHSTLPNTKPTSIHSTSTNSSGGLVPSSTTNLQTNQIPKQENLNHHVKYQQIPEIIEPLPADHQQLPPQQKLDDKATPSNYCANCCTCEQSRATCCNKQSNNGLTPNQMELARKRSLEENEIVERCKTMTQYVQSMNDFLVGAGDLKNTQDLFTKAESLGDEANKFYKIVRYLTYQVPTGQLKKDLLDYLDKIPTYIQELMFIIRYNTAIGQKAAVNKVDQVLNQAKELLISVQETSNISVQCAKRYNLDLETIQSGRISPMFNEDAGVRSRTDTRRKQAQAGSQDSRRTRVSFLLF